jgi:putative MATE family efflux protein
MPNSILSRVVWRVSIPIIMVEATETLDHLINSVFLAKVGVTELGAIAVADSILLLFLVLPLSLVDGIQILVARRAGQRRPEAVGSVFNQGFALTLLICLVSTVLLKLFSPLVANWFVESRHVGRLVDNYLQIEAYGLILSGATFAYSALLTSLGKTRVLIPATIILIVTDLILNYLFIFGKFGCPALGMRGAAIGSVGAEFAVCIFLTIYVWRLQKSNRYGLFRFRGFDKRTTGLLTRMSAPLVGQGFLGDIRWFVFFLIIERVSTQALAVANIVYTCYIVFWIPTEGFAETTCSMVSRLIGRNWPHRIGRLLRSTIFASILATIPLIAIALFAPQWMVSVFSPESGLLAESNASLRVIALAMLVAIPGEMWFTAVEGTGDTAASLGIELVLTLVMLGFTYFAAIHLAWPMASIWFAVPIAWVVCLPISYGWVKWGLWKRLEA